MCKYLIKQLYNILIVYLYLRLKHFRKVHTQLALKVKKNQVCGLSNYLFITLEVYKLLLLFILEINKKKYQTSSTSLSKLKKNILNLRNI